MVITITTKATAGCIQEIEAVHDQNFRDHIIREKSDTEAIGDNRLLHLTHAILNQTMPPCAGDQAAYMAHPLADSLLPVGRPGQPDLSHKKNYIRCKLELISKD